MDQASKSAVSVLFSLGNDGCDLLPITEGNFPSGGVHRKLADEIALQLLTLFDQHLLQFHNVLKLATIGQFPRWVDNRTFFTATLFGQDPVLLPVATNDIKRCVQLLERQMVH